MRRRNKIFLLIYIIMTLLLTLALIPLNIFVCNFPEWVVILVGILEIIGVIIYLLLSKTKLITKIILPLLSVITVLICTLASYVIPYWNSYSYKNYSGNQLNYDNVITYKQAKNDMDEVICILKRTHPMFKNGLTDEVKDRYNQSIKHLKNKQKITVNDLRREIQLIVNPMHDAHTSTYNSYPYDKYLKYAPKKMSEGYLITSVNNMTVDELKEYAKEYTSYETDSSVNMDVCSLASLDFYNISEPYIFVWENETGNKITEKYTKSDFVPYNEYIEIGNKYSNGEKNDQSFVSYKIDEDKSLAILTITECNNNEYYVNCVKKMFSEIKKKHIENVAVDLRGNCGGDSGVANEFIRYLPVKEYRDSSSDWRWNYFMIHQDFYIKNEQYSDLIFKGNVYILTDKNSFSSAMLFPEMIQDNGIGKVIGESPANNANSYGDIAGFYLKETGLFIQVSTKKWYRIDSNNKSDYIIPDYPCKGSNVYETLYFII